MTNECEKCGADLDCPSSAGAEDGVCGECIDGHALIVEWKAVGREVHVHRDGQWAGLLCRSQPETPTSGTFEQSPGEANDTARLISAAPEMRQIVQLYLDWGHLSPRELEAKYPQWDRTEGVSYIDAKARAALAKVEG